MTTWTGPAGEYIAVLSDANKKLADHARLMQAQRDEFLQALKQIEHNATMYHPDTLRDLARAAIEKAAP